MIGLHGQGIGAFNEDREPDFQDPEH